MATRILDLPEAPPAQAAYRLAADCPCCGAPLVLPQNRQRATLFTGCSVYPSCTFAEPHDPRVQTLATQVVQVRAEARRQVAQAQADAQRQVAAAHATLDRTVRQLIALAHPDRWPDTPLAHELTVALVALRQTLQSGSTRGASTGPEPIASGWGPPRHTPTARRAPWTPSVLCRMIGAAPQRARRPR